MSLFTFILLSNSVWRVGRSNLKMEKQLFNIIYILGDK